MFASTQIVALAAMLASVNAACVHRGAASSSSSSSSSSAASVPQTYTAAPLPTLSSTSSSSVTSSSLIAAPTDGGELTSTLALSATGAASSSLAQDLATSSSSAVQTVATSTASSAATAAATGSASSGSSSSTASDGTKYMVVFGDSYSSTGFYIEGDKPSAENPIGDPALPGSTTTGGLNWVGYVTSEYNTSLVLTYDWAYYGADVSNDIINTGVTTDMIAQVGDFEENLVPAPSYAEWTADNLLVAVWIGINDIGECFWESAEYATCPIDEVMTKYFSLMQNLYDDGVRNFVVNTVPPFYKAPAFEDQTDLSTLISNLDSYNAKLESNMAAFKSNNSDITLGQVFNTTSYFWEVFDNPTTYGLESDITCSNADGTTCVWYDNYHPGQAIHKLVAQGFVDALTGSFF